jgi:outer membrane biosynthesis protein TonB
MSASAFSGDRLLWAAAEEAARQAEFEPPQAEGEPYFMTGTLTYNFVIR